MKSYFVLTILFLLTIHLAGAEMKSKTDEKTNDKITILNVTTGSFEQVDRVQKSDEEWKKILTPEQFKVTRKKGTEHAFSGEYWNNKKHGIYKCICCGIDLFRSDTKFESGSGWPSFWQPVAKENVGLEEDNSFFMHRVEVHCARCGAHLGHVFDDGPPPTGKRYCMNSVSFRFIEANK